VAARIFGNRFALAIDAGKLAADNRPWLGPSKTWRGLLSAYVVTLPVGLWLGFTWSVSLMLISLSMLGDLCASFIKRRLGKASSSQSLGLDQGVESGLPAVFLCLMGQMTVWEAAITVLLFIVVELLLSVLLYRLHIRKRPY
jgi:CDP-2,3-bis-(O-geranylgeranyl)-sn-glycerol synthase